MSTETEQSSASVRQGRFEFRQGCMTAPIHLRPIIDARAPQGLVIQTKSKPADQVQGCPRRGAEAGDVAGIGRDLRFPQSDMKHGRVHKLGDARFSDDT